MATTILMEQLRSWVMALQQGKVEWLATLKDLLWEAHLTRLSTWASMSVSRRLAKSITTMATIWQTIAQHIMGQTHRQPTLKFKINGKTSKCHNLWPVLRSKMQRKDQRQVVQVTSRRRTRTSYKRSSIRQQVPKLAIWWALAQTCSLKSSSLTATWRTCVRCSLLMPIWPLRPRLQTHRT